MENIFKNAGQSENKEEKTLISDQYNSLKDNYKEIFYEAATQIRAAIEKFKPENPCTICTIDCNVANKDIFSDFPVGCKYKEWQSQTLSFLSGEYLQKLKYTYDMIMTKKDSYTCNQCGECCKLAVSEFSYEQLKQKAFRGDKYSADFVSVFVPYKTEEDAKNANPEYFEALGDLVDNKTYYYYCPKLEGNLCSDYETRPNICKEFPHNPLQILPSKCSFNAWRQEIERHALILHAKTNIIEFYKQKLG